MKIKLKFVTFDCPYLTWENPEVQSWFAKMVSLKKKGYGKEYLNTILPVDSTDFIATHTLICMLNESGEWVPIMGYKRVSNWRTERFHMEFPGTSLVRRSGEKDHDLAVRKVLAHCDSINIPVFYPASFTIDPEVRKNEELVSLINSLARAVEVLWHQEKKISRGIAGANLRFKIDRMYDFWGYERLKLDGRELPPIEATFAAGEKVMIFYRKEYSAEANKLADQFRDLWNERLIVTPASLTEELDQKPNLDIKKAA